MKRDPKRPGVGTRPAIDIENELAAIMNRAAHVMPPEAVAEWLRTPVPALGGDRPIERVAQGDLVSVLQLLARLDNDGFT